MKKKEKESLKNLKLTELGKQASDLTQKIEQAMMKRYTETLKNTREIRMLRMKKAVIHTYIREKELEGAL
ncbi:hypothetical protein HY409_02685 [Candidatus Gottesmanbacteria bacterium]|nr:hypothetical protein [Candidatus Gottesmanbacteria bacterium]